MRSLGDSPPLTTEFEVLDGDDLPHSWVGRKVGVETVTAPGVTVGWLQSKSAWRLVVVEDRTGEPWCVPWAAVDAVYLFEEGPEGPMVRQETKQIARPDCPRQSYRQGALAGYEWFLRGPVMVVLAVLWLGGLALLGSCAMVLYSAGSVLMRALAGTYYSLEHFYG